MINQFKYDNSNMVYYNNNTIIGYHYNNKEKKIIYKYLFEPK